MKKQILAAVTALGSSGGTVCSAIALLAVQAAAAPGGVPYYQIGSEWGKFAVTAQDLASRGDIFKRLALATASYGGVGTAFYLGKFNGHHVMATNYHVMKALGCSRTNSDFQALGRTYYCAQVFGSWQLIDLSLFEVDVPPADEPFLRTLAHNFDFDAPIYTGQRLLTIGYGGTTSLNRTVLASEDSDCKVFSPTGQFRPLSDPDAFSTVAYTAWSFANGCDVAHGDSGAPFVDRETGALLGLLWTARIPRSPLASDSASLDQLLLRQGPEIWTDLTYAVPAEMIRKVLSGVIEADPVLDNDARATIGRIVQDQMD